ncbi:T-cell receptor gamma chain C region C10.5 [Tupaia chinensis]|nr:T-cell receptor gamma chain C region C10.5 [Tupaia chinensis]
MRSLCTDAEDIVAFNVVHTRGPRVEEDRLQLVIQGDDKTFYTDISPKPTTFLPSVAETNLHDAGTYLCLLEKFFPDVIYVQWKEKNGSRILESQQGKTVMTDNTYMKLSWLTVSGSSLNKEHQCIVKHENNKGGVDQEILFPPIRKDQAQLRRQRLWEALRLQLINASAYHTYLLLLLKSVVYFSIITFCLFRRAAVCGTGNKQEQLSRQLFREALQLQLTSTSAYYTYLLLLLKSAAYSAVITFCVFRRAALCGTGKSSLQTEA